MGFLSNLFGMLKEIDTWAKVLKVLVLVIALSVVGLFTYYQYESIKYKHNLEVIAGVKDLVLSEAQNAQIRGVVNNLVEDKVVDHFYVRVLQPDERIIKKASELVYAKTANRSWEDIQSNHWCDIKMDLSETPSVLVYLNTREIHTVVPGDDSYIGRYLEGLDEVYSEVYMQGMYVNNLLVGYTVFFIKDSTDEKEKAKIIKATRRIQHILFG